MVDNLNRKLTMIVLAFAAAVIALLAIPGRLGLDLKGGTRLTYTVPIEEAREAGTVGEELTDAEIIDELVRIWLKRIDPKGLRGVVIRRAGANRVVIEIPGSASAVARDVRAKVAAPVAADDGVIRLDASDRAALEAFPVTGGIVTIGQEEIAYKRRNGEVLSELSRGQTNTARTDHPAGAVVKLQAADPWQSLIENTGRMEFYMAAQDRDLRPVTDLEVERQRVEEWIDANPDLPIADYNLKLATEHPDDARGRLRFFPEAVDPGPADAELSAAERLKNNLRALIVEEDPKWRFSGADVAAVRQTVDETNFPAVGFDITAEKGVAFGKYTGEHIGERMAVVINDEIVTFPNIEAALEGGGIITGGVGGFENDEVQNLVQVLKSGSLKITPQFESKESLGATLGRDYIRRGTYSALAGIAVVVAFIIYYYRLLGLFSVLALAFNLLLLMGAMRILQTTLTLPGIAGIVLTVGMAVDANILIFERMREELLRGQRTIQAAKDGFANALSTILDANITTLITGLILFSVGSGPVKGFAATLCIGIVTSVFSALVVTRLLLHFAFERGVEQFTMKRFVKETSFGFMAVAKPCLIGSLVVMAISVAAFSVLPAETKLGIDFLGGNSMTITTRAPQSTDTIRARIAEVGENFKSAQVQEISSSARAGGFTQFRLEFTASAADRDSVSARSDSDIDDANVYQSKIQRALSDILSRGPIEVTNDAGVVRGALFFEQPHPVDGVAEHLANVGLTEVEVTPLAGTSERAFEFTARAAATAEAADLYGSIESAFDDERDAVGRSYTWERPIPQSDAVGPQVVQELRDKAILAILLSLFAIVMYIRVRFAEYSYGLAAVAALVHDVVITLGVLAAAIYWDIVEAKITLTMIAAFLTIIGYSLNDTIVVFDRIRENLPKFKRPLPEIIDLSVNQTLARTLLTSGTTLLAVLMLLVFNFGTRNALEGFSFAVLAGVGVGTYSTIFIASPILLWLENRRLAKGGELVPAPREVATDTP